jgi:hypothetical protein
VAGSPHVIANAYEFMTMTCGAFDDPSKVKAAKTGRKWGELERPIVIHALRVVIPGPAWPDNRSRDDRPQGVIKN